MPGTRKSIEKLGVVEHAGEVYTACVQYRNEADRKVHIRGPRRASDAAATNDLIQMRDAGAVGRTREEGLSFMKAEALRIRLNKKHEDEAAAQNQRFEEDSENDDDLVYKYEKDLEEPWIPEPSSGAHNADSSEALQLPEVLTPAQATIDLMCFRPTI